MAALGACAPAQSTSGAPGGTIPDSPEPGTLNLGTQPWIGYGPFTIADKQGYSRDEGLEVNFVTFASDTEANTAIAAGQIDAMNAGVPQALRFADAGLPIKIIRLQDVSTTADGIMARPGIDSLADLKGRRVASEEGSLTAIELYYALSTVGLTTDDVTVVNIPVSQSSGALVSGQVDAAVTYEPFMTALRAEGMELIFTAGAKPGLIGDALVARQQVIDERPGQLAALIRAWQRALDFYASDTERAQQIIAEDLGSTLEDLGPSFAGVTFFSVADNRRELGGVYAETLELEAGYAREAGLTKGEVDAASLLEPRFVEHAGGSPYQP